MCGHLITIISIVRISGSYKTVDNLQSMTGLYPTCDRVFVVEVQLGLLSVISVIIVTEMTEIFDY
ncbi:hypothetical protein L3081_16225 [Colwellia sp. MSW7]|uniref:Uncharacterized protein n=1 Tax=Colwellia maritima TaxID=2912588 RepID=A0ABS9X4G7_9GAMM|nr:hypothetical protein [Colwellia maritima]MCI2284652.1 hypothetical protein [Colwellia maritima]